MNSKDRFSGLRVGTMNILLNDQIDWAWVCGECSNKSIVLLIASWYSFIWYDFYLLWCWQLFSIFNEIGTFKALSWIFKSNIAKWAITDPVFWHRSNNVATVVSGHSEWIVTRVFYVIFNTSTIKNIAKDTIGNFIISWNDLSYAIITLQGLSGLPKSTDSSTVRWALPHMLAYFRPAFGMNQDQSHAVQCKCNMWHFHRDDQILLPNFRKMTHRCCTSQRNIEHFPMFDLNRMDKWFHLKRFFDRLVNFMEL